MSVFFPHVDLPALKAFAISTAIGLLRPPVAPARRGKKLSRPQVVKPIVVKCEDVIWAGEQMVLITFASISMPLGPREMLAHFPKGRVRLTTQALVGMSQTVLVYPELRIRAPKVYAYRDVLPNKIGAEVVLLEKIPGHSLDTIWPTLTPEREHKIIVKLVELLLGLFNHRGNRICTDLVGTGVNTTPAGLRDSQFRSTQDQVLLAPAFDQGPLIHMEPQEALSSTDGYLRALVNRIDRVFKDPIVIRAAKKESESAQHGVKPPPLTNIDVARIKDTWHRYEQLIPHHSGGFYLPDSLPFSARNTAYSVLQSDMFGIFHSDMKMSRFIVSFDKTAERQEEQVTLTLTGWEHAHRAPLWLCAQLPPWLFLNTPTGHPPVPLAKQQNLQTLILSIMFHPEMVPTTWEWIVAYVFGKPERWFEACLSAHWSARDKLEICLEALKPFWEERRPDIPFPVPVGADYRYSDGLPS